MKTNSEVPDFAGAEKKIRQAEFFLAWLEGAPEEIARQRSHGDPERPEPLEFWFSACLSASQSVYYVLYETGGTKFKKIQQDWRNSLKNPAGPRFGRMIGLRDNDVHFAKTGTEPLQKYIKDDNRGTGFPYHQPLVRNAALYGHDEVLEMENPDGTKVGGSILRGTVGLYLDRDGGQVEATTACREFIEQLRSLVDATRAAFQ